VSGLQSNRALGPDQPDDTDEAILRVEGLTVQYRAGRGRVVHAVSDVSFSVERGETLGLVGETGCGKSSVGRAILQLPRPTAGRVYFEGRDLTALSEARLRTLRPELTMILQNPIASLNPRRTVAQILSEPLELWPGRWDRPQAQVIDEVLVSVGLDPKNALRRRSREFSGGQCQRISIARALLLRPKLIVCDEPVSSLDVSVQAAILNLLEDAKATYGLTLVFISHDLAVVKNISDRVAVMYLGKLCEVAPSEQLYAAPAHPYTRVLLEAIPEVTTSGRRRELAMRGGDVPSPIEPPSGCRFRTRCPMAAEICAEVEPPLRRVGGRHLVACHFAGAAVPVGTRSLSGAETRSVPDGG
jgi:peptide/nickel transport system ATP-binding protein